MRDIVVALLLIVSDNNNIAVQSQSLGSWHLHSFMAINSWMDGPFAEAQGWPCQASAGFSGGRLCVSQRFGLLWILDAKHKWKVRLLR